VIAAHVHLPQADASLRAELWMLRQRLKTAGRRMEINDSWIAATTIAHAWPLATQDHGFPSDLPDLTVIEV